MDVGHKSLTDKGFSLLEVLIAVVIMSVGLLALASLQLNLIQSSADAKARSIALALAKEKLEQLAAYQEMGGSDSACVSPSVGSSNTCYRAITDETIAPIDGDPSQAGVQSIGGINFTRQSSVARYVFDSDATGTAYNSVADTALDATLKAISGYAYVPRKEFKRIVVSVGWTDAGGQTQSVQVESAIGGIEPADSVAVAESDAGSETRKAVSIITNPASVAGVIPIAINSTSDTAATNPRPVIVSHGNSSTLVETRFDIYTYTAQTNTIAQAKARVETAAVGCKCSLSSGTQTAFRPTYWNGYEYAVPEAVTVSYVSTPASGITQSELCTACCRDHHDPAGVAAPKFDPRRSAHNHYLSTDLSSPVTSGAYNEACRLIRVDGIYRVAADAYEDHYGLLATAGLNQSTPSTTITQAVPTTGSGSVSEQYQTFVLNYLGSRFVTGSSYNTVTDPTTVTGYSTLQTPAKAYIASTSSPQFLHARGLNIDYLESEVIALINEAKDSCPTGTPMSACVLPYLPFTSINLTELGDATSSAATTISVSNYGLATTIDDSLPVKGKAEVKNGATTGAAVDGTMSIQRSSAGLALTNKVFPDSELTNNMLSDSQAFEVGAGEASASGGEQFTVTLTGAQLLSVLTLNNPAEVRFTLGSETTCDKDGSTITPYTCVPGTGQTLGGSVPVKIGNYNRSSTVTVQNSCTRSGSGSSDDTTTMPYLITFGVSSATVDGVAVTPNAAVNDGVPGTIAEGGEYTIIPANPVNDDSVIAATFSNATYLCPSNYSTYITDTGDDAGKTPTTSGSSAQCNTGSAKTPKWATTYIACPGAPL